MDWNIHPVQLGLNTSKKKCPFTPFTIYTQTYFLLFPIKSELMAHIFSIEPWTPLNPVPFCCISPKKFLFLENSSPLLTLLFWPAFCWQEPGAHQNHCQDSSHLTFLLTLDCWPLFSGFPKQHSFVLFSQVLPHMYRPL